MNQKFEKGEMSLEKAVFFALREFVYAAAGIHLRRTEQLQARRILRQLELDPWASMETGEEDVTFVRGIDASGSGTWQTRLQNFWILWRRWSYPCTMGFWT